MATSLIRIPQPQGGTMYAFASGARDITRAFNNPDLKFDFTKYALLDLPDFATPEQGSNTINFSGTFTEADGGSQFVPTTEGANVLFAKTLQNYAFNLEELLLQDDDFDPVLLQSDAEKVFFKWLARTGAIRFKSSDSSESTTGTHYTEELDGMQGGTNYERVVKYVGTIDAENDIAYEGNTYHEVYVNVPSSVGNTPTVLFKQLPYNTTANRQYASTSIEGRDGQTHPDPNLDMTALVDDFGSSVGAYYDISTNANDNVHIDFNEMSYHGIVNDSTVSNFVDYSKTGSNFRFNAVLVYYDLYSESNPENRSTNLYGIMILDNIEGTTGSGSRIHEQIKFKPNAITGLNGNAFSLKLNIKFNTSLDNVGVETNINDFTTFSMDMFLDTSTVLENAADLLLRANNRYSSLADRMEELEKLVLASEEYDEILMRLSDLEKDFQNAAIQLQDSDSLLKLITKAHDKMNSLIDGTIPVELQYNTDVIFNGLGTEVDKSVPNKIKVNNSVHGYAKNSVYLWDINSESRASMVTANQPFDAGDGGAGTTQYGIWTQLKPFTNRLSFINLLSSHPNSDLNIYIDDNNSQWREGQVVKIAFETIDMNGNDITIRTRANNGFDILIAELSPSELLSNKPYIEIVCIDPVNYTFEVDILR